MAKKKNDNKKKENKVMDNEDLFLEEDLNIVQLQKDDGPIIDFCVLFTVDYKNEDYAFLQPVNFDEIEEGFDEDEVIIMKIKPNNDKEDELLPIKDEKLLDKVFQRYLELEAQFIKKNQDNE